MAAELKALIDNVANMHKMREQLARSDELGMLDIITYGCSAYILNLLAHDIEILGIKSNIKKIMKYFRNTHFAAAKYKQANATRRSMEYLGRLSGIIY